MSAMQKDLVPVRPVQVFGFLSRHLVTCMTFATLFLNCVPGGERFVKGTPKESNLKYLQWPKTDLKVHPNALNN